MSAISVKLGARTEAELKIFEELLTYKENIFCICLGFSKNPYDAEDLTQDVFLKAYQNIGTLRNPSISKEWLLRIARNTCLDHKKRKLFSREFSRSKPDNEMADSYEQNNPEASASLAEQVQNLKKAVSRLPKKQKEVFVLREYGHLSYQEIACTLDIKEGTVMSRLNRARQAVLKLMKEGKNE
jgi:RNA polymerase sigma-70 factor (ECF subfamily)